MLCCIGLVAGIAVGQYFGGPWIFIGPAIGFILGLVGDIKFMKCGWKKKCHKENKKSISEDGDKNVIHR